MNSLIPFVPNRASPVIHSGTPTDPVVVADGQHTDPKAFLNILAEGSALAPGFPAGNPVAEPAVGSQDAAAQVFASAGDSPSGPPGSPARLTLLRFRETPVADRLAEDPPAPDMVGATASDAVPSPGVDATAQKTPALGLNEALPPVSADAGASVETLSDLTATGTGFGTGTGSGDFALSTWALSAQPPASPNFANPEPALHLGPVLDATIATTLSQQRSAIQTVTSPRDARSKDQPGPAQKTGAAEPTSPVVVTIQARPGVDFHLPDKAAPTALVDRIAAQNLPGLRGLGDSANLDNLPKPMPPALSPVAKTKDPAQQSRHSSVAQGLWSASPPDRHTPPDQQTATATPGQTPAISTSPPAAAAFPFGLQIALARAEGQADGQSAAPPGAVAVGPKIILASLGHPPVHSKAQGEPVSVRVAAQAGHPALAAASRTGFGDYLPAARRAALADAPGKADSALAPVTAGGLWPHSAKVAPIPDADKPAPIPPGAVSPHAGAVSDSPHPGQAALPSSVEPESHTAAKVDQSGPTQTFLAHPGTTTPDMTTPETLASDAVAPIGFVPVTDRSLPTAPANAAHSAPLPTVPVTALPAFVAGASASGDAGPVDLALAPEELGRLRMQMVPDGDTIRVTFLAERPETMDLLRRNTDQFLADLRQQGFASASFSFGQWGDPPPRQSRSADIGQTGGSGPAATPSQTAAALPTPAGSGLDLRL